MNAHVPVKALLVVALIFAALPVADAGADFGIEDFTSTATAPDGTDLTQAGAHPDATTRFDFNTTVDPFGHTVPDEDLKDAVVEIPSGLVVNPLAAPRCPRSLFSNLGGAPVCPVGTQVGVVHIFDQPTHFIPLRDEMVPLYNLEPSPGAPAQLGFRFVRSNVVITPSLRSDGDYGVTATVKDSPGGILLFGNSVTLWGVPASPSHDAERFRPGFTRPGDESDNPLPSPDAADPRPFVSNPATCGVVPTTHLEVDSWQNPGAWVSADASTPAPTGCEKLNFEPTFNVRPSSTDPDSATGIAVELGFAQDDNPASLSTPPLRDARVVFPEGMTINPSVAAGLAACADSQLGLGTKNPLACPEAAKLGSVTARSPLLEQPLHGDLYARPQASADPQSGQMFRLGLVLESAERGISIRLPGQVRANGSNGRLEAVFADNPQLPVDSIELNLKSGPRAPLANPSTCGTKTTTAHLTSWGGQEVTLSDSFTIPCPAGNGFSPSFLAGTLDPLAGTTSPFTLQVRRSDGQQTLGQITTTLPPGLSAYLKGIPYCADGALAAAASRSGLAELSAPSCPAASRVGSVRVGAGAGNPYYVTGSAYLSGPYKGAPLSLAVVVPAAAGPFDLGTVVVRNALRVDPTTAQITAVSDQLPTIVSGVPVRVRSIDLEVDRPAFTLNPTSCEAMAATATLTSSIGTTAPGSSRFQASGCGELGFKPKLAISLKGAVKRGGFPQLTATLKARKGDANIGRASVALPHSEFLAQSHIRTICTRVQYAADQCPAASVYGHARAISPLLDQPLEGPVYLRSSDNELPDLVAALHGQIDVDLVGRIDSLNGGIRTTFATVPDAPVSKFVLKMKGGKRSLLENSRNLCRTTNKATVRLRGQNGRAADSRPVVRAAGCRR